MMLSKYTEIAASDITPYRNPNESNGESDMLLKISKCMREAPVTNENILEMIDQFVANKEYDINCRKDGIDDSCLLWIATKNNRLDVVKYLLENLGANLQPSDKRQETLLIAACSQEHIDIVKYIVDRDEGQNINDATEKIIEKKDTLGRTPLCYCVQKYFSGDLNSLKVAMYLLYRGAKVMPLSLMDPELACRFFTQLELLPIDGGRDMRHFKVLRGQLFMVGTTCEIAGSVISEQHEAAVERHFFKGAEIVVDSSIYKKLFTNEGAADSAGPGRDGVYRNGVDETSVRDFNKIRPMPQSDFDVALRMLPIRRMCSDDFLEAFLLVSDVDPNVLSNPVVMATVDYMWSNSGVRGRRFWSFLFHVFSIVLVSVTVYTYHDGYQHSKGALRRGTIAVLGLLLIDGLRKLQLVLMALNAKKRAFIKHSKFFFVLDSFYGLLVFVCMVSRLSLNGESELSVSTLAFAALFGWCKLLYYFQFTNMLMKTIFVIVVGILPFITVLFILVVAFSQALYILSYHNNSLDFFDKTSAILSSFMFITGMGNYSQPGIRDPKLATFLMVVIVFLGNIIFLNLVVSMMGNILNDAVKNSTQLVMRERIVFILLDNLKRGKPMGYQVKIRQLGHFLGAGMVAYSVPDYVFCLGKTNDFIDGVLSSQQGQVSDVEKVNKRLQSVEVNMVKLMSKLDEMNKQLVALQ